MKKEISFGRRKGNSLPPELPPQQQAESGILKQLGDQQSAAEVINGGAAYDPHTSDGEDETEAEPLLVPHDEHRTPNCS